MTSGVNNLYDSIVNRICRMRPSSGMRGDKPPIAARQLLQTIHATSPESTQLALLYPEAMMFPRIFPVSVDNAPLGAMPLPMMMRPWSGQKRKTGLGTFAEHISIRVRNPRLLTAMQQSYRSFLFSAKMNMQLTHQSLRMLMKRGPEELAPKDKGVTVNLDPTSDFIQEDIGLKRRGRELAAMIRDYGKWSYFVTLTCNLEETPSVSDFMKWMTSIYKESDRYRAYISHLPVILRLW